MKDLLNFDITSRPEGNGVLYLMRHRKRDLSLTFRSQSRIAAEHVPTFIAGIMKSWVHKYAKATRKNLSPKQKAFYDALVWFWKEESRSPSYEEMCDLMNWKSKGTTFYYVKRLIANGWLWTDEDGRVIPIDIAAPDLTE